MENAAEMDGFLERVKQCRQLLQDDRSRKIYEARIALDCAPFPANVSRIAALSEQQQWMEALDERLPFITRTEEKPCSLI